MIGAELALDPNMGLLERCYVRLFGVPISGLRIRLRRILPKLEGRPARVLDAGCGSGIFTHVLAEKFPRAAVVGVDLNRDQLEINRFIARKSGLKNLSFQQADVLNLPFKEVFDLVLSVDNLEHVEDDTAALRSMGRVLLKGGRLVLHVPAYERRWFFFSFKTNFDVHGHFRPGYRRDELVEKIGAAGLTVTEAYFTYGWWETITNNISYAITRAEKKRKLLYAAIFPLLNGIAWFGRNSQPKKGAGILVVAHK